MNKNQVFHVSQTVSFSESNGLVFSGISSDLERLKKYISKKVAEIVESGCNNPVAEEMKIERWR